MSKLLRLAFKILSLTYQKQQNALVFYKGNPKNIKKNYPELDLSYIETNNINYE